MLSAPASYALDGSKLYHSHQSISGCGFTYGFVAPLLAVICRMINEFCCVSPNIFGVAAAAAAAAAATVVLLLH